MSKAITRTSKRVYGFLLRFYPKNYRQEFGKEMKYIFSQSLKDVQANDGTQGIITLWARTAIDVGKSLVSEHLDTIKGGSSMKARSNDVVMQNKVFLWVATGTLLLLLIPFLLMTFKIPLLDPGSGMEVINWTLFDFIVMGSLIFGASSVFVFSARRIDKKYRLTVAIACVIGFVWLWAELAVGIFTNWGS